MTKRIYTSYTEEKRNKTKEYKLLSKFGLTLAQYHAMFEKQKGCCGICGYHQDEFSFSLAVDHDHKTGAIRGLLCAVCNLHLDFCEKYYDKCREYLDEAHRLRMLGRGLYISNKG